MTTLSDLAAELGVTVDDLQALIDGAAVSVDEFYEGDSTELSTAGAETLSDAVRALRVDEPQ